MVSKMNKKYKFSPPYQRDNRLVMQPIYTTIHTISYSNHMRSKYSHIKSRYKQQPPFIKPHNARDYKIVSDWIGNH